MTLTTTPLSDRFGVEVHGVDLHDVRSDNLFPDVRGTFETHSALLFRNQDLDEETHLSFGRLFGPIEDRHPEQREKGEAFRVPEVSNVAKDGGVTGEMDLHTLNLKANFLWHVDSTFLPIPALANIITAKIVPTEGGATELASTRAAFADMPDAQRNLLRKTRLRHHLSHSRARISEELARQPQFHKWPTTIWPAVWKNPVNGREAVYVASHAFGVEGMDADKAVAFVDELIDTCTKPPYVYRHEWRVGDVLIWDQRAVLHRGTPWPYDQPRKLASICVSARDIDGLNTMVS